MSSAKKTEQAVRRIAISFPEVSEGVVCQRASFEAGKKRFLFLEEAQDSCLVLLKLQASLAEATKLATAFPDCYRVGGTGWVTMTFTAGQLPPTGLLERWIEESYRLLVPKKIVAQLAESRDKSSAPKKSPKKSKPKRTSPSR